MSWLDLDLGLQYACRGGQIEVIDYLVNSSTLSRHANINCSYHHSSIPNGAFLNALQGAIGEEHIHVIEHLLYQYNYVVAENTIRTLKIAGKAHLVELIIKRDLFLKISLDVQDKEILDKSLLNNNRKI